MQSVMQVTLHTNYSVAVVKFDNATYIETVLKLVNNVFLVTRLAYYLVLC